MPPEDNTAWIDSLVENNDEVDERFATKVIIEYYYVLNKSGSQHMEFVFSLKKWAKWFGRLFQRCFRSILQTWNSEIILSQIFKILGFKGLLYKMT